jgi:hypothetical protein
LEQAARHGARDDSVDQSKLTYRIFAFVDDGRLDWADADVPVAINGEV